MGKHQATNHISSCQISNLEHGVHWNNSNEKQNPWRAYCKHVYWKIKNRLRKLEVFQLTHFLLLLYWVLVGLRGVWSKCFLFGEDYGIFYFWKQSVINRNSFIFVSYKFPLTLLDCHFQQFWITVLILKAIG